VTSPAPRLVAETALAVARGDAPWDALQSLGVEIIVDPERIEMRFPHALPDAKASVRDLALGFIRHWTLGSDLREWATVILGADFIDFVDLDDHPHHDVLVEALWSASAGESVPRESIAVIRRVAESARRVT
jgi:hypothetical protein